VWFLAKLLAAERQRRGTPRGSRALTCFWQAVLGLRWFRDRTAADALARDHRISRATAYAPPAFPALPRGTRVRAAHRPVAHPSPHHRQPQQNRRHRPRGARPHPFRAQLHHMNFVDITSMNNLAALYPMLHEPWYLNPKTPEWTQTDCCGAGWLACEALTIKFSIWLWPCTQIAPSTSRNASTLHNCRTPGRSYFVSPNSVGEFNYQVQVSNLQVSSNPISVNLAGGLNRRRPLGVPARGSSSFARRTASVRTGPPSPPAGAVPAAGHEIED
jgi:hypothetical protein